MQTHSPAAEGSIAERFRPIGRIPELDLLRFLAATMVVSYHFTYRPYVRGAVDETVFGALQSFSRFGYLGVALFFMISGFVILWSAQARSAGEFVVSRIARLYPSFWVCMLLTASTVMLMKPTEGLSGRTILANLTMVPGAIGAQYVDVVYWTLAVELKFYLLIFVVLVFRSMNRVEVWLAVWLAASIMCLLVPGAHWLSSAAMYPFGPYFISGCLFYLVRSKGMTVGRVGGVVVSCALTIVCTIQQQSAFIHNVDSTSGWIVAGLIISFHALLTAIALIPAILPPSIWWLWLGSLTYPLYLLHNRIGKRLWNLTSESVPAWTGLLLTGCAVYFLAWVVAAAVERRAHKAVYRWLLHAAIALKLVPANRAVSGQGDHASREEADSGPLEIVEFDNGARQHSVGIGPNLNL